LGGFESSTHNYQVVYYIPTTLNACLEKFDLGSYSFLIVNDVKNDINLMTLN